MSHTVITTIQAPTRSAIEMIERGLQQGLGTIVIGDRKTPEVAWPDGSSYFSLSQQRELGFSLADKLPECHYSRKNIGYLVAISRQSLAIFDTDDDNAPLASWHARPLKTVARDCVDAGWINVYQWFSDTHIWPRGLPLAQAGQARAVPSLGPLTEVISPIQQGLANGSPDVDAIWRLLMDKDITFRDAASVHLPSGRWCPFNSQSTWWFPEAYALMYLPSNVSFRMTDIWRSFIAQRCLWAFGRGVVFHGPEMFQDRNEHNLMRDFEQEVPGYLGNDRIRDILENTTLLPGPNGVAGNLRRCYEALVQGGIVPPAEMPLVDAWLADLERMT